MCTYRPRVYKIPMVRMFTLAGELTNLRMYGSKKKTTQKCMGALKRSRCGSVEICPTNDHAVLQAQPSRQVYSRNLRGIYVQIGLSERGKAPDSALGIA